MKKILLQQMIFNKPKTFITQVKALNKGQTVDAELIWRSFQGVDADQNISYFCLQLFEAVLHSEKKVYLIQNQQRLYATLLCMQLYKNKKPKSAQVLQQCRKFIQKKASSHGKTFMQFLFSPNRDNSYTEFFIGRLCMIPKQIDYSISISQQIYRQIKQTQDYINRIKHSYSTKGYEILKKRSFPKVEVVQSKLLSFGYLGFIDHIKCDMFKLRYQQYKYIVNALSILMQASKNLSVVEEYILILVHFIINCLTYYGCQYQNLLKQLLIWANQIRNHPGVLGTMGSQLFTTVYDQLKIPGHSFRKKVRKDFPALDQKQSVFLNKQFYMVTDKEDIFSRHQDRSLQNLRKLSILHILNISGVPQKQINQFKPLLKYLSKEPSFHLYSQCVKIIEAAMKLDNILKIRQIIKQYITKLVSETKNKIQSQALHSQPSFQALQSQQFDILANKMNDHGFFKYPKYEIITVPISDFTNIKSNGHNIMRIVQKNKADYQGNGFLKYKIPLIFHGDGYSFIKFVKSISQYQQSTPIQQLKLFQIFYIPKHQCNIRLGIAVYLSYKDHWYRKFVYNIFKEKLLYPHLQVTNSNKDLFPFYLYNKMLQLYLRGASNCIHFRVFKCLLTMSQSNFVQCFYMISFLAMGLFCQAQIIKMTKQKQKGKQQRYLHKELIQIIQQKIKKNQIMNVSIEITYAEQVGTPLKTKKQKNMRIQDIQICNLPHDYFMGKQPNPSSPNLQMTILTQQNGKIFRKEVVHSNNFKEKRPADEIQNAFKDLFICQSIRSVTIENLDPKNPLRLMVDGTVANKIQKIQIQPAVASNGMPISLPIQCFLPIN